MDAPVARFHLGLGIGVIGPVFYIYISPYLGPYSLFYSPLLASSESRNRFDCPFF